ncbi:hypothetical protein PIB30_008048 [Stylosanthes scabra]|uniref:Uncharacterized protein n=1 Tax=Stylosanthes scabra TaxID=79078 RepID=A0ABU6W4W8_9FABA|nr:hypothetical protein [Stylosanthes scabra]
MDDGQEASVTPDNENLDHDLDGDQVGPETGNSGRRVFVGLGDDQSKQTQEMRHWMRSVEERLAQKSSTKRGRSRAPVPGNVTCGGGHDPRKGEALPPRRRRSPSPRRRRSPTPGRRRRPSPDYHDDGWEQGIVGRTPFAPHILRV